MDWSTGPSTDVDQPSIEFTRNKLVVIGSGPFSCSSGCGTQVWVYQLRDILAGSPTPRVKSLNVPRGQYRAAVQITIADLSMSLDNVLAVAGAAREHPAVLFVGLVLSVTFMGMAASFVAKLIHRFPILAWAGLRAFSHGSKRIGGLIDRETFYSRYTARSGIAVDGGVVYANAGLEIAG